MDKKFYKESLFSGMTSNSFKLGTVLTLGWFWVRVRGCMMLYRGNDFYAIDFTNILAVFEADAEQINVPGYLEHRADSGYLYVVRRANCCGEEEKGLRGLVSIRFDSEGRLEEPRPNSVFGLAARQVATDKAELGWFYCPLGQGSVPVCFRVYSDGGSGQIVFENEIGLVGYEGRGFYSFTVEQLNEGANLFAVRAEDESGVQDGRLSSIGFELDCAAPQKAQIVRAETL
jgi:hypothetical protein